MIDRGPALSPARRAALLETLRARFEAHPGRHPGLSWSVVAARLESRPEAFRPLAEMEATGGEPDVVGHEAGSGVLRFVDCSLETPSGRTSLCYDRPGWESRKAHHPAGNAVDLAARMGIEILTEAEYLALQRGEAFDQKTSSWVRTPPEIRDRGGALYGERRYGRVFVGHNGAQSYYAARGFRGSLSV